MTPATDRDKLGEALKRTIVVAEVSSDSNQYIVPYEELKLLYAGAQAYHAILPEITELIEASKHYEVRNLESTGGTLWVPEQVSEDEWEQRQVGYIEGEGLENFITKAANLITSIARKVGE